jgi:hypothetical protein
MLLKFCGGPGEKRRQGGKTWPARKKGWLAVGCEAKHSAALLLIPESFARLPAATNGVIETTLDMSRSHSGILGGSAPITGRHPGTTRHFLGANRKSEACN